MRFLKKKKKFYSSFLFVFLFFSYEFPSFSKNKNSTSLSFHGGYIFKPFSTQKSLAVYLSIFNKSNQDIDIEKFETEIAENTMIHETITENNITKMKMVDKIKILAKDSFFMQPGGTHIMLTKLKSLPKDGDSFILKVYTNNDNIYTTEIMVVKPFENPSDEFF